MKIFGIDFAPWNVPVKRRLETFAVLLFVGLFIGFPITSVFFTIYVFFWTQYWNYLRDYFPIKLEKTCDLDPKKNYIFGYHPHGIFSVSMFTNFATDATGFPEIFPGISVHPITLVGNFWFPIRREIIMFSGACESSKESLQYLLSRPEPGHAAVIVIGGAAEVLDAAPGRFDLVLETRYGFVKLALEQGAQLVPVFSFGENDLYVQVSNPPGSLLRKIQIKFKNYFGFTPPIFSGRGIFNYTIGLMPYRKPVVTIVGKPISVEKTKNPTKDQIIELHSKYKKGLTELFETNKKRFGIAADVHLKFH